MCLLRSHMSRKRETEGNGGDRDRTDDPLLAKQVLSQLSYAPVNSARFSAVRKPEPQLTTDA